MQNEHWQKVRILRIDPMYFTYVLRTSCQSTQSYFRWLQMYVSGKKYPARARLSVHLRNLTVLVQHCFSQNPRSNLTSVQLWYARLLARRLSYKITSYFFSGVSCPIVRIGNLRLFFSPTQRTRCSCIRGMLDNPDTPLEYSVRAETTRKNFGMFLQKHSTDPSSAQREQHKRKTYMFLII
jgi:hypothetical protein